MRFLFTGYSGGPSKCLCTSLLSAKPPPPPLLLPAAFVRRVFRVISEARQSTTSNVIWKHEASVFAFIQSMWELTSSHTASDNERIHTHTHTHTHSAEEWCRLTDSQTNRCTLALLWSSICVMTSHAWLGLCCIIRALAADGWHCSTSTPSTLASPRPGWGLRGPETEPGSENEWKTKTLTLFFFPPLRSSINHFGLFCHERDN